MTARAGRLGTFLDRWVPGWRLARALRARARARREEKVERKRLTRLGARSRDGPH